MTDEYGWTDLDWLKYCKDERANDTKPMRLRDEFAIAGFGVFGHAIGSTDTKGQVSEGFDKGHHNMKLDDFVSHPIAAAAGLRRAHVLALRLYTSSVYRSVNKPLHDGCSPEQPHPYPALVANQPRHAGS